MEIRLEKDGPAVGSLVQTVHSFSCETQTRQAQWEHRLREAPGGFLEVQLDIQQHFRQGADLLTASLLAHVTQQPEMESHVQRARQESVVPLRAPERRPLQLRVGSTSGEWRARTFFAHAEVQLNKNDALVREATQVGDEVVLLSRFTEAEGGNPSFQVPLKPGEPTEAVLYFRCPKDRKPARLRLAGLAPVQVAKAETPAPD